MPADQSSPAHVTVLLHEAIDYLLDNALTDLKDQEKVYVDATVGSGGHLIELLKRQPRAKIIALDQDTNALAIAQKRLSTELPDKVEQVIFVHSNYADIDEALLELEIDQVDGILADLGVSSMQLDTSERGFSFSKDAPLDMRMDQSRKLSAYTIVNTFKEEDLANILYEFGEERQSRKIARAIVNNRPIESTSQLANLVEKVLARSKNPRDKSHPATRTFQAIRIATNNELDNLEIFLHKSVKLLKNAGKLVIISFHSLEDRIVKNAFKGLSATCICPPKLPLCLCNKQSELRIITKKPISPNSEEILANIRSRSAKLRVGEKISLLP